MTMMRAQPAANHLPPVGSLMQQRGGGCQRVLAVRQRADVVQVKDVAEVSEAAQSASHGEGDGEALAAEKAAPTCTVTRPSIDDCTSVGWRSIQLEHPVTVRQGDRLAHPSQVHVVAEPGVHRPEAHHEGNPVQQG
jgi:hypothetical protein